MDFKSKLATLTQPKASEQSASAGAAAEHSAGAPARSSTLAELREKMAEILENPGLLPRPTPAPSCSVCSRSTRACPPLTPGAPCTSTPRRLASAGERACWLFWLG